MKGAAKTRNGTAANAFGDALLQQAEAGGTLYQGLIAAGERACERKANAKREQGIQRIGRHRRSFATHTRNPPCIAKLAPPPHHLKKRLTAAAGNRCSRMARADPAARNHAEVQSRWHIRRVIRLHPLRPSSRCGVHDLLFRRPSTSHAAAAGIAAATSFRSCSEARSPPALSHWSPICLWPTWGGRHKPRSRAVAGQRRRHTVQRADPGVPPENPAPFRAAGTRRSELYLSFAGASGAPKHVSADTFDETLQPIDRIFLSISAHHDTLRRTPACARSIRAISIRRRHQGKTD